jgi:hypothetical protein
MRGTLWKDTNSRAHAISEFMFAGFALTYVMYAVVHYTGWIRSLSIASAALLMIMFLYAWRRKTTEGYELLGRVAFVLFVVFGVAYIW